ncbi:MAG: hypothetical protein KDD06_28995, partial [Phaeodactylibacter sp.]|nr:hypothetical protein [Phaeodactylibacter sp.]
IRAYITTPNGILYSPAFSYANQALNLVMDTRIDLFSDTAIVDIIVAGMISGLLPGDTVEMAGFCWNQSEEAPRIDDGVSEWVSVGAIGKDTIFRDTIPKLKAGNDFNVRAFAVYNGNKFYSENTSIFTGDAWKRKTPFPGTPRWEAVAFELEGKIYYGTGAEDWAIDTVNGESKDIKVGKGVLGDFWCYDPIADPCDWPDDSCEPWSEVNPAFPGAPRRLAVAFSMGGYGYVGMGVDADEQILRDFYRFHPNQGWEPIDSFPQPYEGAVSFVIGNTAYVGFGRRLNPSSPSSYYGKFYRYDTLSKVWEPQADLSQSFDSEFRGPRRNRATAFTIGGKAYVGFGRNSRDSTNTRGAYFYSDFYEFNAETNTWREVSGLEGGSRRQGACGFSIGKYGYIVGGDRIFPVQDWWRYDPEKDQWSIIEYSSAMAVRTNASVAVVGREAYVIGGKINDRTIGSSIWVYYPAE